MKQKIAIHVVNVIRMAAYMFKVRTGNLKNHSDNSIIV